jgi:arabinofuranan 3-O-arabinosyltransferase
MPSNNPRNRLRSIDPVMLCWALFSLVTVAIYAVRVLRMLRLYSSDPSAARWGLDFSNYWQAARLTLVGAQQMLFEPARYLAYLQGEFGQGLQPLAWSYPPHFLLFTWPLGFLSYGAALGAFLFVTFALFVVSLIIFRRKLAPTADPKLTLLALFPYALIAAFATQNGFFTAAITLLALTFMNDRPVVAGLALAVLTVKPQLGFLFPLVALLDRNWALLRWATLFTLALVALSAILFGVGTWQAYFSDIIPHQHSVMTAWTGVFLLLMPTPYGSLRVLGLEPGFALALHWIAAAAAGIATLWLLWRLRDPLQRAFVLLAGTLLISPYAFNYDMGALCVTAALVALSPRVRQLPSAAICFALIAVVPGLLLHLAASRLPLTPLLLASGLATLWHIERNRSAIHPPA